MPRVRDMTQILLAVLVIGLGATLRFPLNVVQVTIGAFYLGLKIVRYRHRKR